jgi:cyclopropane-fatty-acyl-phospholipid synthase
MRAMFPARAGARDLPSRILARQAAMPASVAIQTADGKVARIGDGEPCFEVRVINDAGMAALRSLNELKICEAYIRGDLDFEGDLIRALELRQILSDRQRLIRLWAALQPRLLGRRRLNPEWVAKHYDSNNIQLLAVDTIFNTYTPGIYETGDDTLEGGAARKLEAAFHALRLKPGDTVLDVGCGWGGFLRYCAREGVNATGITLSRHQLDFARKRLREDGLDATVLYQDFFSFAPAQRFDGICMMGVLEDLSNYRFVLKQITKWLNPGGLVYCDFAAGNRQFQIPSFVTKHVWPGAFRLVSMSELTGAISESAFEVLEVHNDRRNYQTWAKVGHARWLDRRNEVVDLAGERVWRLMRVLFAATAHMMGPTSKNVTAYRMVLELRG